MSDCGLCFYGSDENLPAFCDERIVTARREHRCCECRETIQPGTDYEYVAGKWDGRFDSFKTCLLCVEIRRAFACDSSWTYTTLWEDLQESFEHFNEGCLSELTTAAAKQKLVEQWRAWKFE